MSSKNSIKINASLEKVWQAFTNPSDLEKWLVPNEMAGKITNFEFRENEGYTMTLTYPQSETETKGKTNEKEDQYTSTYSQIILHEKIVQAIHFDSANPAFSGEMIMETTFERIDDSTLLTIAFSNIPEGIKQEDNEAGTASSLKKLAKLIEQL